MTCARVHSHRAERAAAAAAAAAATARQAELEAELAGSAADRAAGEGEVDKLRGEKGELEDRLKKVGARLEHRTHVAGGRITATPLQWHAVLVRPRVKGLPIG